MTKLEFLPIVAYMVDGISKPLSMASVEVYFKMLGDLPAEALQAAVQKVLLEHKWATFPSIAELRQAAAETMQGSVSEISPAEAWDVAWRAVGRIDLEIPGSLERGMTGVPPLVAQAMRSFGFPSLIHGKEPVGVIRGQFLKIYEQLQARDRRLALLPGWLKRDVERIGETAGKLPPGVAGLVEGIGDKI